MGERIRSEVEGNKLGDGETKVGFTKLLKSLKRAFPRIKIVLNTQKCFFFFNKKKTTLQAMLVGENADKNTKAVGTRTKDNKGRGKIIVRPDKVGASLSRRNYASLHGIILIEIQHIIQSKEDFFTGAYTQKSFKHLLEKHTLR